MNYLEDLLDGRRTIREVSNRNYIDISDLVSEFRNEKIDAWKTVTPNEYIAYAENYSEFNHVSFEEFKELLKLDQTVNSKRKRDAVRKITDKALVKQLSIEMLDDSEGEITLIPETKNAFRDLETTNDRCYQLLWSLGYRGEEIEGIPRSVIGNFNIFQSKEIVKKEIKSIVDIKNRLEYYLKGYKRNPSFYKKAEGIREAFEDYDIGMIRRFNGNTKSIDQEMQEEKQKKHEAFFDTTLRNRLVRRDKKDYEYKDVEKILDDIKWERITPNEKVYAKLFDLEFDHLNSKGSQIAKSGSKEYVDLTLWREVRNQYMEQAYTLYTEALKIPKANEYLRTRFKDNEDPNPVTAIYTFLWEKNISSREKKGKEVTKEEKNHLQKIKTKEEKKLLRILPESMWKKMNDRNDSR